MDGWPAINYSAVAQGNMSDLIVEPQREHGE